MKQDISYIDKLKKLIIDLSYKNFPAEEAVKDFMNDVFNSKYQRPQRGKINPLLTL